MPDTAVNDPLLQPLTIRHVTFKNRFMSTSHAAGIHEGGMPAARYQAYHEEKAKGGIGLSMFGGSSNVAADSPNTFEQLNVGVDAVIPHLQKFSERMHRHGAKLMCQITHLGRRADPYGDDWLPPLAPSPSRETLHRAFAREMDREDIDRVVKAFGDAAWRCKEGGLDGIETLAGGHLIGQFLSPATNQRTDDFGGSLENRCRFGMMVYDEIRRRVGDDFLVGFRFVVDEGLAGGLTAEDCIAIAETFEASGNLDFFNAIYGRMDTAMSLAKDNMPTMAMPIAPWLEKAAAFKRAVKLPVFHAARISDLATARYAISEGLLDMVGMTRAHIADPYIVAKLEAGTPERIRPCVGATHCMSAHRPTCVHNPSTGRETRMPHVVSKSDGPTKKIVVVGGGPAGLEAARVSAERGHSVVLMEAASQLGGQVRLAKGASWRGDILGIVDWRVAELERLGVEVHLNRYAESDDVLALKPDVVIMATGGVPDVDWIDGAEHVTSSWDAITEAADGSEDVILWDGTGRHAAVTAAESLSAAGAKVTMFAIDELKAAEEAYAERQFWKKRLYELNIEPKMDRRLLGVRREGNRLIARFENEITTAVEEVEADKVVVEHGTIPADDVFQDLRGRSANNGVTDLDAFAAIRPQPAETGAGVRLYRIGDCLTSRNIAAATFDAFRLCVTL